MGAFGEVEKRCRFEENINLEVSERCMTLGSLMNRKKKVRKWEVKR